MVNIYSIKQNHDSVLTSNQDFKKELNVHFENQHNLPLLASRIYSTLISFKAKSFTFEEIIELTCASKSSVSNQLNFLIEEGQVDYYFKDNKRKRYFKMKRDYLQKTLESHLEKIEVEIKMLSKINKHKENQDFNKKLVAIFKNYLGNEKQNILKTIDQLKQTSYNLDHHEN